MTLFLTITALRGTSGHCADIRCYPWCSWMDAPTRLVWLNGHLFYAKFNLIPSTTCESGICYQITVQWNPHWSCISRSSCPTPPASMSHLCLVDPRSPPLSCSLPSCLYCTVCTGERDLSDLDAIVWTRVSPECPVWGSAEETGQRGSRCALHGKGICPWLQCVVCVGTRTLGHHCKLVL